MRSSIIDKRRGQVSGDAVTEDPFLRYYKETGTHKKSESIPLVHLGSSGVPNRSSYEIRDHQTGTTEERCHCGGKIPDACHRHLQFATFDGPRKEEKLRLLAKRPPLVMSPLSFVIHQQ